jgi:NAD(P)-dependent dehydrogenase (short-subunit alcohol dehydrogenase family)
MSASRAASAALELEGRGRVALITGGASGIGRATAEVLVESGWRVLIADLDADAGTAAAAELSAHAPDAAAFVAADVGDTRQAAAAVQAALERWGRLDLVVNNAGVVGRGAPIDQLDEDDLERVIAANLKGPFHVCKHAVAALKQGGGGVILNVSSITAASGSPDYAPYAATKAGVVALTRSLARRVGRSNIRVNCLNLGSVEGTRLMEEERRGLDPELRQRQQIGKLRNIPLGRAGQPRDVAWLILFLASPLARHIHGAVVTLDGGESLGYL